MFFRGMAQPLEHLILADMKDQCQLGIQRFQEAAVPLFPFRERTRIDLGDVLDQILGLIKRKRSSDPDLRFRSTIHA